MDIGAHVQRLYVKYVEFFNYCVLNVSERSDWMHAKKFIDENITIEAEEYAFKLYEIVCERKGLNYTEES